MLTEVGLVEVLLLIVFCVLNIRRELRGISLSNVPGGGSRTASKLTARQKQQQGTPSGEPIQPTKFRYPAVENSGAGAPESSVTATNSRPTVTVAGVEIVVAPAEDSAQFTTISSPTRSQRSSTIASTSLSDLMKKVGSTVLVDAETAAKVAKYKPKTQAELYAHYLTKLYNRLIFLGAILCLFSTFDPSGKRNLFGRFGNLCFILCQAFLGYVGLVFWFFSWVKFYLDFHHVSAETVEKCRLAGFAFSIGLNFLFTFLMVLMLAFHRLGAVFFAMYSSYLMHWIVSGILFSVLSTFFAWKTISLLSKSAFRSKNQSKITKLTRKTAAANFIYILCALMCLTPYLNGNLRTVSDEHKVPPNLLYLSVITPVLWSVLLFFNWIRYQELGIISAEPSKDLQTPSAPS